MTYNDFLIRKEHNFFKNVHKKEVLEKSESLKSLENFYTTFQLFVRISFLLYELYDLTSDINRIEHT